VEKVKIVYDLQFWNQPPDCLIYRRVKSEEDRRTLEKDLVWTYIQKSMANAIQPGQMRCSTDNKNSNTVQVCHSRTGTEERRLRHVSGWTFIKHPAGTTTSIKWRRRHTTATPYPSQTETLAVAQQTSRHNAIPNLQDHSWIRIYSLEPSKERGISQIEGVQLRAPRFSSGNYRDESAVLQWWWTKT
jgi:hypothetical protein